MKIAAAIGMAIALIVLFVVALNMEPTPPVEPISPQDRVKPQVVGAGQIGGGADRNFRADVFRPDPFKAITKVPSVEVGGAVEGLVGDSMVLGVQINGEAKAYPVGQLNSKSHAVVNDELNGQRIAVTWSGDCQSAAVFARKSDKLDLVLQSSGSHWRNSLLLQDESGGLWSQLTAECKQGALGGNRLKLVPATLTVWSAWKKLHPNTTVMDLATPEDQELEINVSIMEDPNQSLVGLLGFQKQKGYRRSHLYENRVINDKSDAASVVLVADPSTHEVRAFDRSVNGNVVRFRWRDGQMIDEATESGWNPQTGECVSGELKGEQLTELALIPCLASKWREIHRDSEMWSPRELGGK